MRRSFDGMVRSRFECAKSYAVPDDVSIRRRRLRPSHATSYGSTMHARLRWSFVAAALATATAIADAQRFIGTVMQPDGRTPAPGVLVVATDAVGRDVATTVSGDEGRFTIFVDSAMSLTLRLLRTGFQPTLLAARQLASDEIVDLVAVLGATPIRVPALRRGMATCGRPGGPEREAMAIAMEEARKALVAAQGLIGRDDISARFVTFDHRTAKTGEDTLRSLLRRSRGSLPSLFRATTTEELEASGFFVTISGERIFRAPEPVLLASDWFTSTHCFVAQPQGDSALRLAFRPSRERKGLVDIEGAYVFDPRTLGLRRVEFKYVNQKEEERHSNAGGLIEFMQVPTGEWFATHWWQRFPLLGYRSGEGNTTFIRSTMTLIDITGHRTQGGRLLAVLRGERAVLRTDPAAVSAATLEFSRACPERAVQRTTAAARGTLVPADSESVTGILVRATWGEPVVVDRTQFAEREQVREAFTDANGGWLICDLPARREVTLRWESRGQERTQSFTIPVSPSVFAVPRDPEP
jgi:hypothetical protein